MGEGFSITSIDHLGQNVSVDVTDQGTLRLDDGREFTIKVAGEKLQAGWQKDATNARLVENAVKSLLEAGIVTPESDRYVITEGKIDCYKGEEKTTHTVSDLPAGDKEKVGKAVADILQFASNLRSRQEVDQAINGQSKNISNGSAGDSAKDRTFSLMEFSSRQPEGNPNSGDNVSNDFLIPQSPDDNNPFRSPISRQQSFEKAAQRTNRFISRASSFDSTDSLSEHFRPSSPESEVPQEDIFQHSFSDDNMGGDQGVDSTPEGSSSTSVGEEESPVIEEESQANPPSSNELPTLSEKMINKMADKMTNFKFMEENPKEAIKHMFKDCGHNVPNLKALVARIKKNGGHDHNLEGLEKELNQLEKSNQESDAAINEIRQKNIERIAKGAKLKGIDTPEKAAKEVSRLYKKCNEGMGLLRDVITSLPDSTQKYNLIKEFQKLELIVAKDKDDQEFTKFQRRAAESFEKKVKASTLKDAQVTEGKRAEEPKTSRFRSKRLGSVDSAKKKVLEVCKRPGMNMKELLSSVLERVKTLEEKGKEEAANYFIQALRELKFNDIKGTAVTKGLTDSHYMLNENTYESLYDILMNQMSGDDNISKYEEDIDSGIQPNEEMRQYISDHLDKGKRLFGDGFVAKFREGHKNWLPQVDEKYRLDQPSR